MKLVLIVWSSIFLVLSAQASPVVDIRLFEKGAQWTWGYSEFDEALQVWKDPYLYETYEVTKRKGDQVTIEMSSHKEFGKKAEAHHKFIANIKLCLRLGQRKGDLKSWKIKFFTKSYGPQWELVSKSHKGLAFTEKFNCYSGEEEVNTLTVNVDEEEHILFQFKEGLPKSWYLPETHDLTGIMLLRLPRSYKVELVDYKNPTI